MMNLIRDEHEAEFDRWTQESVSFLRRRLPQSSAVLEVSR
jgi:hypothetical protein